MGVLTACDEELSARVTAGLPKAFGHPADPMVRLAVTPAEARALLVGSRLLGRTLPMLLGLASQLPADVANVVRWARPRSEPRGMLMVRVHISNIELAHAQAAAARYGLRPETYLVARSFELLRVRAAAEPVRWAFVGLPAAQMPGWTVVGEPIAALG